MTIWSDSALLTRGSLAPCATRSGVLVFVAGVEELLAVSGGSAEIGRQHSVAPVGEELPERVEGPRVTSPRSPVGKHQQRQVLRGDALWQRQVGGDLQTVRRWVAYGPSGGQVLALEILADAVLQSQLTGFAVEQISLARLVVRGAGNNPELLVAGARAKVDLPARKLRLQPLVVVLVSLVLPVFAALFVAVIGGEGLVGKVGEQRRTEVHALQRIGLE